ncbi:hypothetical protein [Cohnella sp. REN36]|uniref:hypothetical protein n=1 Tax=Cohnella sp. REN36 TaxID=2887347 RepID=UPI001D13FB81|nr:hypothetical protein [Cohnella sp. REN36]MCC3371601.1 hypothetical protein [Cohnella sp. REN36]
MVTMALGNTVREIGVIVGTKSAMDRMAVHLTGRNDERGSRGLPLSHSAGRIDYKVAVNIERACSSAPERQFIQPLLHPPEADRQSRMVKNWSRAPK